MKETAGSIYLGFFYICIFWASARALSVLTDVTTPASLLRAPPPCPGPRTPCQPQQCHSSYQPSPVQPWAQGGTGPGCQTFRKLNSLLTCFVSFKLGHFFNLYCFLLTMGIAQTFLLPSSALSQPLGSGRSHCSAFWRYVSKKTSL